MTEPAHMWMAVLYSPFGSGARAEKSVRSSAIASQHLSLDVEAAGFDVFSLRVGIDVDASLSADTRLQLSARRESVLVPESSPSCQR
jgi:hypothetical protein